MPRKRSTAGLKKQFVIRQSGWSVYSVDAFEIRNLALPDEEFTNFATRNDFADLIPDREIWIARQNLETEGMFFIANAITQMQQKFHGADDKAAYNAGTALEGMLREKVNGVKFRDGRPSRPVPKEIYVEKYTTIDDAQGPIEVWRVEGNLVRSLYKTDYCEGGHGYVYPWCPKQEIWLEKDLDKQELPFIVCHEYFELRLMRDKGFAYDRAHKSCSRLEFDLRKGKGLTRLLAPKKKLITKQNVRRLVGDDVFDEAVARYAGGGH